MLTGEIKKKLRTLKQQEIGIRTDYGATNVKGIRLIWDQYFSTKTIDDLTVKYSLKKLSEMNHDARKEVFDAFFCSVFIQHYKENGIPITDMFDRGLLSYFGLPATATKDDIKSRFRHLAKINHPDKGGNSDVFIEILDAYEQLTSKS